MNIYPIKRGKNTVCVYCVNYVNYRTNSTVSVQIGNGDACIIMHLFFTGVHDSCGTWCKYGTDPKSCYRSLPYHKPLSDEPLWDALDALIVKYVAKADSLSAIGSSQANESFNQMVSSKAPKNKFV